MSIIDQQKYYCLFFLFNSNLYVHHRLMKVPFPPIFSFLCPTYINENNIVSFFIQFSFLCPTQINGNCIVPFSPNIFFMSNIDYLRFYVQHRNAIIVLSHMFGFRYTFYVLDRSTRIFIFMSSIYQQKLCSPFFPQYIFMSNIDQRKQHWLFFYKMFIFMSNIDQRKLYCPFFPNIFILCPSQINENNIVSYFYQILIFKSNIDQQKLITPLFP